jgi:hypothetical protein
VTRSFCDKVAQNDAQTEFRQILYHDFFSAKNRPKIWACYVNYMKLQKGYKTSQLAKIRPIWSPYVRDN